MNGAEYQDDPSIPDAAVVWRRVPPEWVKFEDGVLRPSTGAFGDSSDGSPMSAVANRQDRGPESIVARYPGCGVIGMSAKSLRDLGFALVRAPDDEDEDHIYVAGNKTKGARKRMKYGCWWLVQPAVK